MARRGRGKARRPRRGAEFWREAVRRHASSGQTVREFCESEELALSSFTRWRSRLAERDEVKERPAMVPLEVVTDGQAIFVGAPFEVMLRSGHHLRVPPDFDEAALRRLMAVLDSPPC